MLYDGLLLMPVLAAFTGLLVFLNGGQPVSGFFFQLALYFVCLLCHLVCRRFGDRTPGMLAWRLRVQEPDGGRLSLPQFLLRFFVASLSLVCCGLGFFWVLVDSERRSWHDLASGSRTLVCR